MHEYISEFTSIVEHAHQIKPNVTDSHLLATQFIQGISNLYIKSRLRFLISKSSVYITCQNCLALLCRKTKNRKLGNLILAKRKHTLISMPSRAKAVSNVVVKTIISKTALTIRTMATMAMVTVILVLLHLKAKDFTEPKEMKAPLNKHFKH